MRLIGFGQLCGISAAAALLDYTVPDPTVAVAIGVLVVGFAAGTLLAIGLEIWAVRDQFLEAHQVFCAYSGPMSNGAAALDR